MRLVDPQLKVNFRRRNLVPKRGAVDASLTDEAGVDAEQELEEGAPKRVRVRLSHERQQL